MKEKLKAWLNRREEWIYINDENDEIVCCATNKEFILGFAVSISFIIFVGLLSLI